VDIKTQWTIQTSETFSALIPLAEIAEQLQETEEETLRLVAAGEVEAHDRWSETVLSGRETEDISVYFAVDERSIDEMGPHLF
jgi:hypothetical protein